MSQTSGDSCTNSFETACAAYLIAIINNTIKYVYNTSRVILPAPLQDNFKRNFAGARVGSVGRLSGRRDIDAQSSKLSILRKYKKSKIVFKCYSRADDYLPALQSWVKENLSIDIRITMNMAEAGFCTVTVDRTCTNTSPIRRWRAFIDTCIESTHHCAVTVTVITTAQ
ncbi:hypothetical protein FWK35_00007943 [Aphis craccivora]|uniref:Uncharacterized protein n=1 Tax=Aphis craccivora TaxID=307492 RepID=A0A6G0Z9W3_APHCR|nr:hypothetical protein FWK35_00007943 [Aphis craccivora]